MQAADEIERKYANEAIRLAIPDVAGTGVLSLNGEQTFARITTSKFIEERDPNTGWFDIVVKKTDGSKILLHNALTTTFAMPSPRRGEWEARIFPNVVVLNAEHILPTSKVREIRFTARGMEEIFHYRVAEWQSVYRAPTKVIKSLRDLRQRKGPYPRQYDFFRPVDVYLVHQLPPVCHVRVGDRTYEIFVGRSESHGASLTISPFVVATIRFDEGVSIDDALEAAWAWRRFFVQLTMKPLPFISLSCRAKVRRRDPSCDLYLPNLAKETFDTRRGIIEFSPADVPYGQWKHRKKFGEVMRRWIALDQKRRLFRVRLDRVLEQMRNEYSPQLVAQLCAAIEGLTELRQPSTLKKGDLDTIITAASLAAESASVPITKDRIVGVLSLLNHQSLPQRLKLLVAALKETIPQASAQKLIGTTLTLRTFEAHGGSLDDMSLALTHPALNMLASVCVLWDLATSGMPVCLGDRRLTAARRVSWFGKELMTRSSPKVKSG